MSDTDLAVYMERVNHLLVAVSELRGDMGKLIDDHEQRLRALEAEQIRLEEQAKLDNRVNRAISLGAATAAGVLGSVIK